MLEKSLMSVHSRLSLNEKRKKKCAREPKSQNSICNFTYFMQDVYIVFIHMIIYMINAYVNYAHDTQWEDRYSKYRSEEIVIQRIGERFLKES